MREMRLSFMAAVAAAAIALTGCAGLGGAKNTPSEGAQTGSAGNNAGTPGTSAPSPSATPTAKPDPLKLKMQQMSLDEKIGQLVIVGLEGKEADNQTLDMIFKHKVGGFILFKDNIASADQTSKLLNTLKAANASANAAAPLWLSVDQEGGRVNRLPAAFAAIPTNRAIGQIGKTELSAEIGARLAEEVSGLGFNMNYAPVLDVDSNPKNPVIGDRSFGPSADLVSRLGIATMQGIRSGGVVPVVKHFPGHGDTSVDSHRALPVVNKSKEELKKLELVPFARAIQDKAEAVMVAHILLPKLDESYPASLSKGVITDLLRGELGYDGVVITDDMTMGAVLQNYAIGEAAVRAVQAGADIVLVAHDNEKETEVLRTLKKNVEDGKLSMSRVDESVYRILKLKQAYKLADKPAERLDVEAVSRRIKETLQKYTPQK
ncbi:beta-N-acetylhexosaminidase [Paenibacillus sp. MBLB4367]|uniref:beta-N-acetylhexosaminidase n=1 Tax=Paenibacillus sp. MBLB4367 TaxID=3384767 RepID=UPI0039082E42